MKILHVFSDPRMGGPGARTLDIARSLRNNGVESIFAIPEGQDSLANAAEGQGHAVERTQLPRLRSPRRVQDNIRFYTKFPKTVNDYISLIDWTGADIVHVNTPHNFQPAIAASRSDAKLVWHFNDSLNPWPLKVATSIVAARLSDWIVADSKRVTEYYSLPGRMTSVIYPCVDYAKFDNGPIGQVTEFDDENRRPVIGCVGNLNPVKGQDYLLNALPKIVAEFGPVDVRFVGARLDSQSQYYDKLEKIVADRRLADYVAFDGWKSDIAETLPEFDLFVVPSKSESGPIVLLEAMAAGVPVVSTDVGVVNEIVEEGTHVWVVPPKSVDELADSIISALKSPLARKRRAENAKELVQTEFAIETIAGQYLDLYRSVAALDA